MRDGQHDGPEADRAGDFERYALVAMMTLVVLCLLFVDGLRKREEAPAAPPADRLLHIEIGGAVPASPPAREREQGLGHLPAAPAGEREPEPREGGDVEAVADEVLAAREQVPPPRTYVVQSLDTLSGIASRELGSATRAMEIARLNDLEDPDVLALGQTLVLPPD